MVAYFVKWLNVYKKNEKLREIFNYLVVGVLTTVISYIAYFFFSRFLFTGGTQLDIQISNVLSWIVAVTFAYITNRIYVFNSKTKGKEMANEIKSFIGARIFSLLIDMALMFAFTELIKMNDLVAKLIVQVIVIILNYVLSKIFVFKGKE